MDKYNYIYYKYHIIHTLKYLFDVSKAAFEHKINAVIFSAP